MKQPAKRVPTSTAASVLRQVDGFIAKFDPPIQRLIRTSRAKLRRRFPTAVEMVYDNYNFFVIGYGPTERASEAIISLAAYARGVGLAFIRGAKLPDPKRILKGSGNQTRHLPLQSADDLEAPAVEALLRAALAESKVPMPAPGKVRTVIKSVSAKQRPRRTAAPAARKAKASARRAR